MKAQELQQQAAVAEVGPIVVVAELAWRSMVETCACCELVCSFACTLLQASQRPVPAAEQASARSLPAELAVALARTDLRRPVMLAVDAHKAMQPARVQ